MSSDGKLPEGQAKDYAVTIGKILSPYGTGGLIKVYPYSDFPERCYELKAVTVELNRRRRAMAVEKTSVFGRFWLFKLEGVDSREEAARLGGALVLIPPEERRPLPPGRYYFDQIIGLDVYTAAGVLLGRITDIISTGGHDLYVCQAAADEGKELMLPAVKEFVKEIDPAGGRMVVEIPPGLTEL